MVPHFVGAIAFLLAFPIKLFATFRAGNGDLSLTRGNPEPLLTIGTFKMSMGFSLLDNSLLNPQPRLDSPCFL